MSRDATPSTCNQSRGMLCVTCRVFPEPTTAAVCTCPLLALSFNFHCHCFVSSFASSLKFLLHTWRCQKSRSLTNTQNYTFASFVTIQQPGRSTWMYTRGLTRGRNPTDVIFRIVITAPRHQEFLSLTSEPTPERGPINANTAINALSS